MEHHYSSVRLLRNHIYPTYQLCATMTSGKTRPEEGLHFAVLTVLQWLRERLEDNCPAELVSRPAEEYLQAEDSEFKSFYLNCGFSIDVVSVPERGVWSMQLTEPDLGSRPGETDQDRTAVPGRVIITNIAFRVVGRKLTCAFQTVISDPEGSPQAPEYRLSVVRRLADAPQFGLAQVIPLTYNAVDVQTPDTLSDLISLLKNAENQLPTVLFVCRKEAAPQQVPAMLLNPKVAEAADYSNFLSRGSLPHPMPANGGEEECPYDAADFARHQFGYGRTYVLHTSQINAFRSRTGILPPEGGVLVFAPGEYRKADKRWEYDPIERRRGEDGKALREYVRSFSTGKVCFFGGVMFVEEAHLLEKELHEQLGAEADEAARKHTEASADQKQKTAELLHGKNLEIQALQDRLARREDYTSRLEEEKQSALEEIEKLKNQIQTLKDADSELEKYLARIRIRPDSHLDIADWLAAQFPDRLLLHDKGRKALEGTSPNNIDLPLLLDALDYMATDLWEQRYGGLAEEDALVRCHKKYDRPFPIKALGEHTAKAFSEYKIKYNPGFNGKPVETLLTDHLTIGNTGGKLLRIYFLYDDKKKLIVIGRLPEHGPTLTIQS